MYLWEKFSEKDLREIVKNSKSYKEVLQKLGYRNKREHYQRIKDFCERYSIEYSHLVTGNKDNLIGQQFGFMKVIGEDLNKNGTKSRNAYWFCECQGCEKHTIKSVCGSDLKRGRITNCGCQKEQRIIEYNHKRFVDLSGQKIGHLLILKPIFNGDNFTNKYLCRCDCGREIEVFRHNLLNKDEYSSCGCMKMSKGERKIEQIFNNLNILYKQQIKFKDLLSPKGRQLSFDFAIIDLKNKLKCLIEYQGQQHHRSIDIFGGDENFFQQQENDELKRNYCKDKNIKLLEIPYWDYDKLNEEYFIKLLKENNIDIIN